jgi:NitT/TauT family transport system ATP-binding protein
MDEPFGALDAQTKLMLEETLLGLWESRAGSTVIFVTHDLGEAVAVSDRVVIMSRRPGRLIADVDIDLPRPRTVLSLQESPHYHELLAMLWRYLRQAMADDTE